MDDHDQYPLSDLRHLLTNASIHHHDLFSSSLPFRSYDLPDFRADSAPTTFELEAASFAPDAVSAARWPRQETLTLLDIRSRLDSKFKEAIQKGPLWDEVSRIMAEEHNYQRSGKKCREKFENLYKYYKKTKEGKAGRQDGKNYRFFRQLEAIYGETSNATSLHDSHFVGDHTNLKFHQQAQHKHYSDTLSLSNASEFETSASFESNDDLSSFGAMDNDSMEKRRKRQGGKCWKAKIKQFIDSQMKKLIDKQETWLEKLMKTLEQKEKERVVREEEWRRQEVSRIERERSFWAKEREWIEARDAALMEALQKLTRRESRECNSSLDHGTITNEQYRRNNQNEDGSEILNNNTADNNYQRKLINQGNKKRKENYSRSATTPTTTYNLYFQNDSSLYGGAQMKAHGPNRSNAGGGSVGDGHVVQDSCFSFLLGEGDQSQSGLWENFGLKLNNESDET